MHFPIIGEVPLEVVLSSGLAALILASYLLKRELVSDPSANKRKKRDLPESKSEFNMEDVALFDGKGPEDEAILTVIDGLVYNLTKGREFYGAEGPYNAFAGRDCTRLLAKNQVTDKTDTRMALNETELEQLDKWKEFFNGKYQSIGKIVGEYKDLKQAV